MRWPTTRMRRLMRAAAVFLTCVNVLGLSALLVGRTTVPGDATAVGPDSPIVGVMPAAPSRPPSGGPIPPTSTTTPTTQPAVADGLTAAFADLPVDAVIGLALAPVGRPDEVVSFGPWTSGPAWSTSKVAVALAAMRALSPPEVTSAMKAMIVRSDNSAAEEVWASLGDPYTAAGKVEAVLRYHDDPTEVQASRIRPGFSAFGQTDWSLVNQARFLSGVACDPQAAPILDLMGRVESQQAWGLGTIPGARIKGGWGPSPEGDYMVRQFGLVPTADGTVAVALAAEPASGGFADGIRDLDVMAAWISSHLEQLPAGTCR